MDIYLQPLLTESSRKLQNHVTKIRVGGLLSFVPFQKSKWCALKLFRHLPHKFTEPKIDGMYQVEWQGYLGKARRHVGGKMWTSDRSVAVWIDDEYIGTDVDFLRYISDRFVFKLPVNSEFYEDLIVMDLRKFMDSPTRKFIYLTFTTKEETLGSLLFMLYTDLLPRTCEYFLDYCVASGPELADGSRLCYKNSIIHRIVKNRWIQLGDLRIDCTIEGITVPDESYCVSHDRRGVLSLSKSQKHRSGPQFMVCLNPNPWMDKSFVAFGQLIDGERTVRKIETIPTYYNSPQMKISISDCGEYFFGEDMRIDTCKYRDQSFVEEDKDIMDIISLIDSDITH